MLLRSDNKSGDDAALLEQMISSAVGTDNGAIEAVTSAPTSTSRLFALLVAGVNRPDVVHADEADAPSSDEESRETDAATTAQPSSSTSPPALLPRRSRPTTFSASDLDERTISRARDPELLLQDARELLGAGADANARDADGNTPLYLSLHIRHQKSALLVVHELLRRGADPNSRRHGATVCHHALRLGRASIVQRLLREGAYPQRSGSSEPLPSRQRLDHFASAHGFAEEASDLMKRALRAAAARNDSRAATSSFSSTDAHRTTCSSTHS